MCDGSHVCLERQEDPSNSQLQGHSIESMDHGLVLVANIKYIIAEEASHLPHFRSIPWLHDAVDQR